MVRTLPPPEPGAALVPVPLGPRRLAARGFNQSERIAAALAVRWTVPMASGLLARVRDTPSQTALTPAARQANVAGVFCVTRGLPNPTFVLVDDVLTTGATLADAARALAQAGAAAVTAVTFARAAIPDFS
jgi:ComF family protein